MSAIARLRQLGRSIMSLTQIPFSGGISVRPMTSTRLMFKACSVFLLLLSFLCSGLCAENQ